MSVSLPKSHVAMEDDLEVDFALARPNAFSFNAMIHVEYLSGERDERREDACVEYGIKSIVHVQRCQVRP